MGASAVRGNGSSGSSKACFGYLILEEYPERVWCSCSWISCCQSAASEPWDALGGAERTRTTRASLLSPCVRLKAWHFPCSSRWPSSNCPVPRISESFSMLNDDGMFSSGGVCRLELLFCLSSGCFGVKAVFWTQINWTCTKGGLGFSVTLCVDQFTVCMHCFHLCRLSSGEPFKFW